jgi:hypothetical protein
MTQLLEKNHHAHMSRAMGAKLVLLNMFFGYGISQLGSSLETRLSNYYK